MSTQAIVQERSQLHNWIEGLPSTQFDDEDIPVETIFEKMGEYPVFTPLNQD